MTECRIPDFFVIGAAKSASTSLCVGLARHPEIFIPGKKELNFFSDPEKYKLGLQWYSQCFEGARREQIIGEGSISYSFQCRYPGTAKRIYEAAPHSRIIYIIRHPLEQIVSLYLQFAAAGVVRFDLSEALRRDEIHINAASYWQQISEYRQYWSDDSIKVVFFDDWKADQGAVLRCCAAFLDRSSDFRFERAVKPFAVTKGQAVDGSFLRTLRQLPFMARIRDCLPASLRSRLKTVFKRQITHTPTLNAEDLHFIVDHLADDTKAMLAYAGRPGFWSLKSDAQQ
jgi:hypothetical protein